MLRYIGVLALLLSTVLSYGQKVEYTEWKNITTSGKLPPQCKIQKSNNNLDVAKYKGRYYMAFRTAPNHFPSGKTMMYIVSTTDMENWTFEKEIKLGLDLREPKFAVYHDTLNLYFFTGSKSMFHFTPKQIMQVRTTGSQAWTDTASIHQDGFVPWRIREKNDTLFLSAYDGRGLYTKSGKSDLRLFWSVNATDWQRLSDEPQINVFSAEEGEFIFDKKQDLYATVRLEGCGSLVCKADKTNLKAWKQNRTKYKYDSALLFSHDDDIYLVSRRNLDGEIDKVKHRKTDGQGRARNLIRYSITKKVSALFKLNKDDLSLKLVTDFPSTGDTGFPGIVQEDADTYLIMNYSSNIQGRKKSWISGQLGKTYIYWSRLKFVKPTL